MSDETIVAIYDTPAHAQLAAADLREAGIPDHAIKVHSGAISPGATTATAPAPREHGFWTNLFGGQPDHDISIYESSVNNGASVVTVQAPQAQSAQILQILESHDPVDIDERAIDYARTGLLTPMPAPVPAAIGSEVTRPDDAVMQLSEENLTVGKRVVNNGGTRIRRFVVEHPVEQDVTLHSEEVILERHPVTDGRPATGGFTERSIEMLQTAEEAVIAKTAHVYEEVGLRKQGADRVETVRDTVRKEEVAIESIPGADTGPARSK